MHPDWCVSEKRKITPHKGGRTVKVSSDVTPETKERIVRLKAHGVSLGDLIEWAAKSYPEARL